MHVTIVVMQSLGYMPMVQRDFGAERDRAIQKHRISQALGRMLTGTWFNEDRKASLLSEVVDPRRMEC